MGEVRGHRPVLRIAAVFAGTEAAFAWFESRATAAWGPIARQSDRFAFEQTRYYEREMGPGLRKTLYAFETLMPPEDLVAAKLESNAWEADFAQSTSHDVPRPLNIDPGYISEAKLVLATTKDRDHRLYLGQGIFGEVTLYFHAGQWKTRPWTYPDFQEAGYHEFFEGCRKRLRDVYAREFSPDEDL